MKAKLLFKDKIVYSDGTILALRAWSVPKTAAMPEGVKYSLAYIDKEGKRVLGYDNAEGKGHHRHERKLETPFSFESIESLTNRFLKEISERRRGHED